MATRETLTAADNDALARALSLVMARSPEDRVRFEEILREKGWREAAETAAYSMQCRTLKLKCWMAPPCHCRSDVIDDSTYGHKRAEVELRRRMLAAGLSLFEPCPAEALAAVEAKSVSVA